MNTLNITDCFHVDIFCSVVSSDALHVWHVGSYYELAELPLMFITVLRYSAHSNVTSDMQRAGIFITISGEFSVFTFLWHIRTPSGASPHEKTFLSAVCLRTQERPIHPYPFSPIQGKGVCWSLSQLSLGKRQRSILDRSPVHHRTTCRQTTMHTHDHSYRQFRTTS